MARNGAAERLHVSSPEAQARALWPALPTADIIRGYKARKLEPESKLPVDVLARLSTKMQVTHAAIAGEGGNADLLSMYPDTTGLWPRFHSIVERGDRKAHIVHEQERMQQAERQQVFDTAVAAGRHDKSIAEATSAFISGYNVEHGRRALGPEFHGREVAQIINDIADGKPNHYVDLTKQGSNIFEFVKIEPAVAGILKHLLTHANLPGFEGLLDVITLQDNIPDSSEYVRQATARIRKIFVEGREALVEEELAREQQRAKSSANMHGHPLEERAIAEAKSLAKGGGTALMTYVAYRELRHVISRIPIPELEEHPDIQTTVEIAMAFLSERVARAAGKVGITLMQEMLLGHDTKRARIARMQLLVDLMHPFMGLDTNEEAVARNTLGQFAIDPAHKDEFTALYRPIAYERAFADLERQDKASINALTVDAIHESEEAERVERAAVRAAEEEKRATKRNWWPRRS